MIGLDLVLVEATQARLWVGFKYTFQNQLQIQLGQIKCVAFSDFSSNTLIIFLFKYIAICDSSMINFFYFVVFLNKIKKKQTKYMHFKILLHIEWKKPSFFYASPEYLHSR